MVYVPGLSLEGLFCLSVPLYCCTDLRFLRQERLEYLRQTWKSSIWSEEDDDSYTLPDPEIPLVYSLHYGQQCSPKWDDGSVPAKTADR